MRVCVCARACVCVCVCYYCASGDLRIVMLGIAGAGKSTTGNTILGRDEFKVEFSPVSITQQTKKEMTTEGSRRIFIIDIPGLPDPSAKAHKVKKERNKCMNIAAPGPHVFLLVIRLDVRLTEEVKKTVKWIQKNFGEEAAHFTIVLFTHADKLKGKPPRDCIEKSPDLRRLIISCGGRYYAVNNEDKRNKAQFNELLLKMDKMVLRNEGKHYTNVMIKEPQRKLSWWETRIILTGGCGIAVTAVVAVAVAVAVVVVVVKKCKK